jgi:hypothetical protein
VVVVAEVVAPVGALMPMVNLWAVANHSLNLVSSISISTMLFNAINKTYLILID